MVYNVSCSKTKQNKTGMMKKITKLASLLKFILIMTVSQRIGLLCDKSFLKN